MSITPLPDPPLRSDGPATFADKGDVFMAALPAFVTEANALEANVNDKEASAVASAEAAAASEIAAAAVSGSTKWVSGTTYAVGDVRWSPANSQSYRRKTDGAGTTDPSSDATNWAQITSLPMQTGNAGKYLKTDGTDATWQSAVESVNGSAGPVTGIATLEGTETLTNKTLTSPSLTNPSLTGTPTAPTAAAGTNTTQIATTQFVTSALSKITDEAMAFSLI